ncbi:MAG: hypothetical protein ABH886_03035 [Candidatus Desantisbacteria bacterium]
MNAIMLIMNKKQRESTAKILYDLAKLSFTGLAIAGIIQQKELNLRYGSNQGNKI